ncbi:hypothetical protein HPB50_003054 [Hyalomma asiaticum]|uniref:Uncharacterized protein n=1 Tax=Hyalomma asiaticum TaxID=266040 RepID=A0ACB7SDY8_HYAAI|nr:hypothetical protein HPB50_003054 [Hyalomma asiaticum]
MSDRTVSAASVRTTSIKVAEQVAIPLALTTNDPSPNFSDSMTAIRSFDANQISLDARSSLTKSTIFLLELTRFPAHMGASVGGIASPNKMARAWAQGLILRPGQTSPRTLQGRGVVRRRRRPTDHLSRGNWSLYTRQEILSRSAQGAQSKTGDSQL